MSAPAAPAALPPLLPADARAERALLAAVLKRPARLADLDLVPADFATSWRHQRMYAAMLALCQRGEPVDYATLAREMVRQGWCETWNGSAEHHALLALAALDLAPDGDQTPSYAARLRDCTQRRRLMSCAAQIAEAAWNPRQPFGVEDAAALLLAVARSGRAATPAREAA